MVPYPPGNMTYAHASFMNVSLRLKKYLKLMTLPSLTITPPPAGSKGSTMLTAKLFSAPAPSMPAVMIPGPPPVITIQPSSAISRPTSRAAA